LASVVEDPESKEYDAKQEADLLNRWNIFDGKGTDRFNNKLLYQRPSYEYYNLYRGPLVEHMIFYLAKTGGDARLFPELMPHKWFCEIYDIRFNLYDKIQPVRRQKQEASLSRVEALEYHPVDVDHAGEAYYTKLIQRENQAFQACVARLMGNFIFGATATPIQTRAALDSLAGQAGTYYSLGSDVHAIFFEPTGGYRTADPVDALHTWFTHLDRTNRPLPLAYQTMYQSFAELLESRKEGLQGAWFNIEGETPLEAFMRRLKKDDPCYEIYEEYVAEFNTRWAAKQKISLEKAQELIGEVERLYQLECAEFDEMTADLQQFVLKSDAPAAKVAA